MGQNRLNPQENQRVSWPSFAWLAITNRCNLNCTHCQRSLLKSQGLLPSMDLAPKVFKKIEDQVLPFLQRIQFGGNNFGEQLFASQWDNYFARVSQFNLTVALVTNATLLNEARIEAMVDKGVEFNFSLEGVTPDSYEAVRGVKFAKFINKIQETCRLKNMLSSSGSKVNLGFTASRQNIREIPELLRMAKLMGANRVTVTHFVPWQESQRHQSLIYHKVLANQFFAEAQRLGQELQLVVDLPYPFALDDQANNNSAHPHKSLSSLIPCYHPWRSLSINEKGDVMPCCATSVVMGNLARSSFAEIWHGVRYQKLRQTVNSARPLSFCQNCALRGRTIGQDKPVAFLNDESILLAAIGSGRTGPSSSFLLRRLKRKLGGTRMGRRILPLLHDYYRRHLAFF